MAEMTMEATMSEPEKKSMVEMKISFDGQNTQVSGPITNELLCQAILEAAAQVIRDFNVRRKMDAASKAAALVKANGQNTPRDLGVA